MGKYCTSLVRMLNGDDGYGEIEVVQRSHCLGKGEFGWVSYKGQRCKIISGAGIDWNGANFEAVYYPSRGKWR